MMFRPVPGYPNYKINRAGQVFSIKRNKFVKEKPGGLKVYPRVVLYKDGEKKHFWCHRLNCEVWVGPTEGKEVHHKNGNVLDYHARNLVPLTTKQHIIANRKMRERRMRQLSKELKKDAPF